MSRPDVAVVGGGPAGCSAAIALAAAGARVVLLEARRYPQPKVCGEFISPEGKAEIEALGAAGMVEARRPIRIDVARLTAPDGTEREFRLPGGALGISREALDETLAQRARQTGAEVREGVTVAAIEGSLDGGFRLSLRAPTGESSLSARCVIAAHGRRGALDRALRRPFFSRSHPYVALKNHFHGPPVPGRVELHAFPGGYCGISEIESGRLNVCLLARESAFRVRDVAGFLVRIGRQNPRLGEWLARAEPIQKRWRGLTRIPFRPKNLVAGDILMAGDAAGVIVPFTGDGISMALRSGRLAARRAEAFLDRRLTASMLRRRYEADWSAEFGGRLRLGRALQALMLRPRLLSATLGLVGLVPSLGEYLVSATRGGPDRWPAPPGDPGDSAPPGGRPGFQPRPDPDSYDMIAERTR